MSVLNIPQFYSKEQVRINKDYELTPQTDWVYGEKEVILFARRYLTYWKKANGGNKSANKALTIPVVSNSYCGEQGNDNMKADIKEIMHACGDKFDFIRLCNEAQEELNEAAFDLDQESRMNGV